MQRFKTYFFLAVLSSVGAHAQTTPSTPTTTPQVATPTSGQATANVSTTPNKSSEKKDDKAEVDRIALARGAALPSGKFFFNASLDHSLGQGTFINPDYFAYVGGMLTLTPSYTFRVKGKTLRAFGTGSVMWEYTRPDGVPESPAAANLNGRRIGYSDVRVGMSAPSVYTESKTGIFITPSLSAVLPITPFSIRSGLITNLVGAISFNRVWGDLWVSYGFNALRGFHTSPLLAVANGNLRDPNGVLLLACRQDQQLCASGPTNTEWQLSNSLNAAYQATQKFSIGATLQIRNIFRYSLVSQVDEYTPKALDSNGNPVASVGNGRADLMVGSIFMSYFLNEVFSVNASMDTFGPPLTRDNKSLRFPFYDFLSGADSLTTYSVGLTAVF